MDIPGVDSILFRSGRDTWPNERPPSRKLARLIDGLPLIFSTGRLDGALNALDEIASFELQPSQTMRLHYWQGQYFARTNDISQAFDFYEMALGIATEAADIDSMICLTFTAANALFNSVRYADALTYFEIALSTWHTKAPDPSTRRLDTEMILQTAVARQKWSIGELDESRVILARMLLLARHTRSAPRTPQMTRQTGNALWQLGLVLRARSDKDDGNAGYLRTALQRMRTASKLYRKIGVEAQQLGRLDVQIAEIYFDLTELHLQRGAPESARSMLKQGIAYVNQAKDYLTDDEDEAAHVLERITRLRATVMWPSNRAATQARLEIESTLTQIERDSAALNDLLLIAKAATLRAEWLMALGDAEKAREALLWALKGFKHGGMGMATRAQRLLRRLN